MKTLPLNGNKKHAQPPLSRQGKRRVTEENIKKSARDIYSLEHAPISKEVSAARHSIQETINAYRSAEYQHRITFQDELPPPMIIQNSIK